jgi:hypothetical protein
MNTVCSIFIKGGQIKVDEVSGVCIMLGSGETYVLNFGQKFGRNEPA